MNQFQTETYAKEIRLGNRLAFSDFFRNHHDQMVRYSMQFVHDKDDAMDIVQEVFIKLWNKRENLDPDRSLLAYLYASIRNRSLNFLRDHSSKTEQLTEEIPDDDLQTEHQDSPLLNELNKYINELPDRQREAFELSRFEGLQHDEIAEVMDVSARTVNNHIVTALKTLRDQLQKFQRKAASR